MSFFEVLGFLLSGYIAIKILLYLSKFVRSPVDVKRLGDWAVVTGATDGIGKGFAKELASRGINIVLVSRTQTKLQEVADEIKSKYNVKTIVVAVDFTDADLVFQKIKDGIQGLDGSIGVLVNNVGMSYNHPEYFLQIENCATFTRDIVSCNVSSVLNVTRAVLPAMVERRRGAVINLSSFAALQCNPLLSVYASTKAFVTHISQDLQVEYKGRGITFQALAPCYVVSKLSKIRSSSFFIPTPEVYAKSALNTLGLETVSTGYWPHDLLLFGTNVLAFIGIQGAHIYKNMSQVRSKALKKKAKSN